MKENRVYFNYYGENADELDLPAYVVTSKKDFDKAKTDEAKTVACFITESIGFELTKFKYKGYEYFNGQVVANRYSFIFKKNNDKIVKVGISIPT